MITVADLKFKQKTAAYGAASEAAVYAQQRTMPVAVRLPDGSVVYGTAVAVEPHPATGERVLMIDTKP